MTNVVCPCQNGGSQIPGALRRHGLTATIPRRDGATVHGVLFAASRVLHSGVDDEHGHFVAAYGIDTVARGGSSR